MKGTQQLSWTEVTHLFEAALEMLPEERNAFLERACAGDAELRREVQSLLEADAEAGHFMEIPGEEELPTLRATEPSEGGATEPSVDAPEEELKPGSPLERYVVRERLGTGGMGVVYLADDPELNRKIAIKLMRPGASGNISASEGRARLMREAQAMAQLSHPNVIAVHDVGTFGEQVFIAMEYVEGSTLTKWLAEQDRPWREIVNMFVQTGRGLAAAHAASIVHRDFKPDNVLVGKDGRPRVLDFGLARALFGEPERRAPDDERSGADASSPSNLAPNELVLTQPGRLMGTPAYMAFEQLMGQGADQRTDQYSFCVALYQGLYGELPFKGQSIETLVREMSRGKAPEVPTSVQVPSRLRRVVLRGLRLEPAGRYPSMDALLDELAQNAAQPSVQSIAVLPLDNFSGDPEQDYFADGMTEELIAHLAKVGVLRVISRTSMMRYKGTRKPVREIAQELNVDGVVEGSVRRKGQRVRITAQLIHAGTERHLWSESYERDVQDVLVLQNDVARAIAKAINVVLTSDDIMRLGTSRQINPQAYEAYLKGFYHWNKDTPEGAKKSTEYFEQAIQIDPSYAPAYARLAFSHALLAAVKWDEPATEIYPRVQTAALKALELDPELGEAHAALGDVRYKLYWSWAEAEKEFKTALELDSNSSAAHLGYGHFLELVGRFDEAIAELKRAEELDPLSVVNLQVLGETYVHARQYASANKEFLKALEIDSNFSAAHNGLGRIHRAQERYEEAFSEFAKESELMGRKYSVDQTLEGSLTYAVMGNREEALKMLMSLESGELHQRYLRPTIIAMIYAHLGEKDKAFDWLEKAYQSHDQGCLYLKVDGDFDPLQPDPRFQDLLRRVGLPP